MIVLIFSNLLIILIKIRNSFNITEILLIFIEYKNNWKINKYQQIAKDYYKLVVHQDHR